MSETQKLLEEKFKPYNVPDLLKELCQYWDNNPQFFSGSFEVDSDQFDNLKAWFQDIPEGYEKVRIFGHDGIDSLIGFWLYDDKIPENAPVIYLSGEGGGTTVIADNFSNFLALLAANRDYDPFDGSFNKEDDGNKAVNQAFRDWILKKFKIEPAVDPMTIVEKARKNHPRFDSWLKEVTPRL
ncbi:MAG: hypothetical protein JW969_10340 [Spirochaetales bacterium]|nr:hypothetical protein [Spirochaetales bacterium]